MKKIFNSTPHACTFDVNGEVVSIPSNVVISAKAIESISFVRNGVTYVNTKFVGDDAGRAVIAQAKKDGYDVIIGSIIAAQAYPGEVVAMIPAAGFERVPPEQKRMRMDRFTIFKA